MLTIFCFPRATSITLAVSLFENNFGYQLPVDQEIEVDKFEALIIDDTIINDNQSGSGVAPIPDITLCVDNESLEVLKTNTLMSVVPPKSTTKKHQKTNNSSLLKKCPKTNNNSKASIVAGVNATAGTENVS
jgi:hypothetical protein